MENRFRRIKEIFVTQVALCEFVLLTFVVFVVFVIVFIIYNLFVNLYLIKIENHYYY